MKPGDIVTMHEYTNYFLIVNINSHGNFRLRYTGPTRGMDGDMDPGGVSLRCMLIMI